MKLALIKAPATYADWYKRPVLGISYISSYVEKSGYDCKVFDAYFNSWTEEELVGRVTEYGPDVIGLSAMTHEITQAANIAKLLKKRLDTPAVVGGCHVTALPEKTLEEFPVFDYGVYGEGESTVLELMQYLEGGREGKGGEGAPINPGSIKGLVFKNARGRVCVNEGRPYLASDELDALPYPAFNHYYKDNPRALADKDSCYVMFTSRGCPYDCAFCMQVLGRKVRRRSPEGVLKEMEFAISNYSAHTFDFADEIFLFENRYTSEILRSMIDSGLAERVRWSALTRANMVTPELVALAKRAGCYRLEMGVESGDEEILKTIGKAITIEQVRSAVRVIKGAGISLGIYFILGHPRETRQTLKKTVRLAAELNTDTIAVGIMVPYPGTRVHDMAIRGEAGYRLLSTDWSEYDKYGGRALEIKGIPYDELVKWQKRALVYFYLRNFRFVDAFKYFWQRRKAIMFFIGKRFAPRKKSELERYGGKG